MARYPQGVSTFIPQIQPYQVDFNFVNNVLQAKQNQYDQNWKQLNKLYGQIYYADLTHDESKEKQKAIVDQIDFNLKRVASLDLSLDQNVTQAQQVFQPFYQDGNLMKDIAWTKNTKGQLNSAEALRSSSEEDNRARYWTTGVDAINYKMQEFKETPYDQIQSVGNVKYTPYVDVMKKAEEVTKEYGDTVTPSFEGGKWIVKTTNGEQLIEPLSKVLNLRLGNDPFIKDMYQTQSYVQRKNYVASEAGNFGGDKVAAERAYLQDGYDRMKDQTIKQNQSLKDKSATYQSNIDELEKKRAENPTDPQINAAIRELVYNKEVIDANLEKSNTLVENYNNGSSNGTTSTGFEDPFANIDVLRRRVDSLVANDLFNRDVDQAAITYAYRNYKQEVEVNQFGLADYKSALRMKEKKYEQDRKDKRELDKQKLDTGDFRLQVNPDGSTKVVPKDERFFVSAETLTDPAFTKDGSGVAAQKSIADDEYRDNILPALGTELNVINEAVKSGKINSSLAGQYFDGQNLNNLVSATQSVEAFDQAIKEGKIKGNTRAEALSNLSKSLESFYSSDSNTEIIKATYPGKQEEILKGLQTVHDYNTSMQSYEAWNDKAMASIAKDAKAKGNSEVAALITNDGKVRTLKEWAQNLRDQGKITEDTKNKLIANKGSNKYEVQIKQASPIGPVVVGTLQSIGLLGAEGTSIFNSLAGSGSTGTRYLEDVDGNRLSSYEQANQDLNQYDINYMELGPSPLIGANLNAGDAKDIANIQGSSVVITGKGGTYERFGKDIFNDISQMDLTKNSTSYGTAANPAYGDYSPDDPDFTFAQQMDRDQQRAVLDYIQAEMQDTDSDVKFKVIGSPIAARDADMSSVTFKTSDGKFWDKLIEKTKDDATTQAGVLSIDQVSALKKNGFSIISDRSTFRNELLANSTQGAVLTAAKNNPDGMYSYTNPFNKDFKTQVKYNKQTGNVGMFQTYPIFDTQTLQYTTQTFEEPIINPGNLDKRVSTMNTMSFINSITEQNNRTANYVESLRKQGLSDDEIRQQLLLMQQ
jgi:hypothetical protein